VERYASEAIYACGHDREKSRVCSSHSTNKVVVLLWLKRLFYPECGWKDIQSQIQFLYFHVLSENWNCNNGSKSLGIFLELARTKTIFNIVGIYHYHFMMISVMRQLARPPKRVDRRRGTKCVGLKCICVVKTLSRGIICIKTLFFLFFSNFGFRETLISSPGILKDRSSSNIQCPEGSYNTQQIMNTRCFLGD